MTTPLREKLRAGDPVLGTFLNLGSPLAAEACALGGFDWLLVDLEHGAGGEEALLGQLHAAAAHGVPVVVRVESAARIRIGHVLDLGAAGVMFPRLDTAEEAAEAIRHLRYPPDGDRGVATYNRSRDFGLRTGPMTDAHDTLTGIVQIESVSAVEEVEAIAATAGVDVLFVGPGDLTHALGVPGRIDAPEYRKALSRIVAAARAAGIAAGILTNTAEAARTCLDDGFTFVGIGSDSSFLAAIARRTADALRPRPA
ncbi:HpcH/HpaI aldolase family protein [Streptomyces sp. NPDC002491]